jgi:hypothetical protein
MWSPLWYRMGVGQAFPCVVKTFTHIAKDSDLQLLDPPVRTGQGLGIWFIVIEGLYFSGWLSLSSLVCAPGGSCQHEFTYVIPCQNGGRKI